MRLFTIKKVNKKEMIFYLKEIISIIYDSNAWKLMKTKDLNMRWTIRLGNWIAINKC